MQDIIVPCDDRPRRVEAHIHGPFAIHPSPNPTINGFTLTHLFTGGAVAESLDWDEAIDLADELNAADNWYFGPEGIPGWKKRFINSLVILARRGVSSKPNNRMVTD